MDQQQIQQLIDRGLLPAAAAPAELLHTHISWLILYDQVVYKIKKPVRYSFADFSTSEKREHYCHEEVRLNKRLAPGMYLGVVPITRAMISEQENNQPGQVIDHAVQMKRMDNSLEMKQLLLNNAVTPEHIRKIAHKMADFHQQAKVIEGKFDLRALQQMFADIQNQKPFLQQHHKNNWSDRIDHAIERSWSFLEKHWDHFAQRAREGYIRDCHGDLTARNIFLYDDPVIFDCIEYNTDFRQIDILNDMAFLHVDLDFFGETDLGNRLYQQYFEIMNQHDKAFYHDLYRYYKSYRANIRAKVTLIKASSSDDEYREEHWQNAAVYLDLMQQYLP